MTEPKKKPKKKEEKHSLLELMNNSEIENNKIIGVLTGKQYKTYCQELEDFYNGDSINPVTTMTEFNKIIKKIGE